MQSFVPEQEIYYTFIRQIDSISESPCEVDHSQSTADIMEGQDFGGFHPIG